jgi:hypothetical protein
MFVQGREKSALLRKLEAEVAKLQGVIAEKDAKLGSMEYQTAKLHRQLEMAIDDKIAGTASSSAGPASKALRDKENAGYPRHQMYR